MEQAAPGEEARSRAGVVHAVAAVLSVDDFGVYGAIPLLQQRVVPPGHTAVLHELPGVVAGTDAGGIDAFMAHRGARVH